MERKLHKYLIQKTKEKLEKDGYKVDDSSSKILLAVNEGGVDLRSIADAGEPDLIAVKDKKVLAIDIVDRTWAYEMVNKVKKYGKIGNVIFVMAAESLENVRFWSLKDIGVSIWEIENITK